MEQSNEQTPSENPNYLEEIRRFLMKIRGMTLHVANSLMLGLELYASRARVPFDADLTVRLCSAIEEKEEMIRHALRRPITSDFVTIFIAATAPIVDAHGEWFVRKNKFEELQQRLSSMRGVVENHVAFLLTTVQVEFQGERSLELDDLDFLIRQCNADLQKLIDDIGPIDAFQRMKQDLVRWQDTRPIRMRRAHVYNNQDLRN